MTRKRAKTGGREKGTPNRKSLRVLDDLQRAGLSLVREYVETARKIEDPKERLAALQVLFRYCYPVLKEIDPTRLIEHEVLPTAPPAALPGDSPPATRGARPMNTPPAQPAQLLAAMLALASTDATGSPQSDDAAGSA